MNINIAYSFFLLLLFVALTGCGSDNGAPLSLSENSNRKIKGAYETEQSRISFMAEATGPEKAEVRIDIDGESLVAEIDLGNESFLADGFDAVLTQEQKDALLELAVSLEDELLEEDREPESQEFVLIRMAEYWSKAPEEYVYGRREVSSYNLRAATRIGNEGIKCIRKNTYVNAEYDDERGVHRDRVKVGSTARPGYECMGRCGSGCGAWWVPKAWTKDCMDHDQCSNVNRSSGGSSDRNCGDEYNEAADDWLWGVSRGCSG